MTEEKNEEVLEKEDTIQTEISKEDLSKEDTSQEEISKEDVRSEDIYKNPTAEELLEIITEKDQQIADLEAENENINDKLQRLQADFMNYRKRTNKEKREMALYGKIKLAEEILPVLDNFSRALEAAKEESDFKSGIELIYRQLLDNFKKEGIEEIDAVGKEFDPQFHEAIMQVETEEVESGKVIEVIQKGFIINERVIRPAMVKVAC